ncbi:MAG TPA: hypothetical protein VFU63_00180 [Ktedonobacterales bacterium]|nr:hypothetical protein [Ktedonobacterales bacterium]
MQSNTSARQGMPMQPPQDGHVSGAFERAWTRIFGKRDPVEAQLRDIARQGTFGAMVSHFFATLLIILFSAASLIALGADSMRAVLASLSHGTLDIPNAVATGVTALLVPAMDVAILRAASKIRLLATRRATKSEMALHIGVVVIISGIETCTYCYMAGVYEHPESGVAWALIIARAMAAPLIGVYLAMDRPHPVTSRDILAQVELGAGAGVIRDVTVIANDADASLDRKMELFGASAVMRDGERDRLQSLIEVARRHSNTANVVPVPRRAIVAASATLPLTETLEHHVASAAAYKAMHDPEPADPWANEVAPEDEAEALFGTLDLAEDDLASAVDAASDTITSKQRARTRNNSGPRRDNLERSKSMREFNRKLKSDAKAQRRAAIRDAVYAILDEWHADGRVEQISDKELARRVAARVNFDVNPSGNTVARWRGPWQSSRTHKAAMEDVEPMEPDALRELVTADSW